jgi:hypothetical protein
MTPDPGQPAPHAELANRLDDAADALDLGDKESPFGLELVGEDVVNLAALLREAAAALARLQQERDEAQRERCTYRDGLIVPDELSLVEGIKALKAVAKSAMDDLSSERDRRVAAQEAITKSGGYLDRIEQAEAALAQLAALGRYWRKDAAGVAAIDPNDQELQRIASTWRSAADQLDKALLPSPTATAAPEEK